MIHYCHVAIEIHCSVTSTSVNIQLFNVGCVVLYACRYVNVVVVNHDIIIVNRSHKVYIQLENVQNDMILLL